MSSQSNGPTDAELKHELNGWVWKCYNTLFTAQQQTIFKKALKQKSDHFNVEPVGTFRNRNQLKAYFQREYNNGYPKDYTIIKPKDRDGRVVEQIVVPKGCIKPPEGDTQVGSEAQKV